MLYLLAPASPTALTTSRTEALQARRSCPSSLDAFTQSFLHRAWPKTRGPESGSRSALIVVGRGLQLVSSSSAPRTRRCGKEKVLDQLIFDTSCSMAEQAWSSLHELRRYTCKAEAATQFNGFVCWLADFEVLRFLVPWLFSIPSLVQAIIITSWHQSRLAA